MAPQLFRTLLVVRSVERRQVSVERRFDVDDNIAPFGHVHDHVGAHRARLAGLVQLLGEVDVFAHAGEFDDAPQRHFAPLAAHIGPPQRRHEIAGFSRQQILAAGDLFHLQLDARESVDAIPLDRLDLRLGLGEGLANRRNHRFDRGLALPQRLRGTLLLPVEPFARELQKNLVVAPQGIARDLAEHRLQLVARMRSPPQRQQRADEGAERKREQRHGPTHRRPLASSHDSKSRGSAR